MDRLLRSWLIVSPLILPVACQGDYKIIDGWGPPAGYGAVQGSIRDGSGAPAPNTLVSITRCTDPLGFFGEDVADPQGAYRVDGSLPPVGFIPGPIDTLRVTCDVLLGPRGAGVHVDTVTVGFAPSPESVVPVARDFVRP